MLSLALSVFEITAISVPLVAILVVQILRTDKLNKRVPDELLEYVSQLLVITGFLFVAAIVAAMSLAFESGLSLFGLISVTALSLGLSLLSIVVLVFPLVSRSLFADNTEQQTLSETSGEATDVEEDLPPQQNEGSIEETAEPDTKK